MRSSSAPGRSTSTPTARPRSATSRARRPPRSAAPDGERPAATSRLSLQAVHDQARRGRARASSPITCSPNAASASIAPGKAARGWNEDAVWWLVNFGAAGPIAACRSAPPKVPQQELHATHWSCASPPGVPKARYGSPSRSASVGESAVRGRLPGAIPAGCVRSGQSICPRVPRQKPSSGIAGELLSHPPLGVAETTFPTGRPRPRRRCRCRRARWRRPLRRRR